MTTLYIIGNGFDLWHNLPTDYGSFYAYAKETLDEMEAYYVSGENLERPWHDFENCLGTYDWQLFYDAYNDINVTSESFKPSHAYGLEDELVEQSEGHVESIQTLFHEWVSSIDVSITSTKYPFSQNAIYLTFNYTDTLQTVYEISSGSILHIHGSAAAYDDLIFGHGKSMEEEPEVDENGDSNRTMFTDAQNAAKHPFYAFQKPVSERIEENRSYFRSLSGVIEVVVIGHSINDIDLPYFKEVAKYAPNCRWAVYSYKTSDSKHHVRQLERCGVTSNNIDIRAYP